MSDDARQFLDGYADPIRDIALRARELILTLVPGAQETLYPGWKTIGYGLGSGMSGQFCSLGPHKGYVNLHFSEGSTLADPAGLLEGTGKKMRHVKLKAPAAVEAEALRALILAAAFGPASPADSQSVL